MKALILTLTVLSTVLNTPNDPKAAQEYCEAYGGFWNLYSNATQDASWYECDVPSQSDEGWDDMDDEERCEYNGGSYDDPDREADAVCVDTNGVPVDTTVPIR